MKEQQEPVSSRKQWDLAMENATLKVLMKPELGIWLEHVGILFRKSEKSVAKFDFWRVYISIVSQNVVSN